MEVKWLSNKELVNYMLLHGSETEKRLAQIADNLWGTVEQLERDLEEAEGWV